MEHPYVVLGSCTFAHALAIVISAAMSGEGDNGINIIRVLLVILIAFLILDVIAAADFLRIYLPRILINQDELNTIQRFEAERHILQFGEEVDGSIPHYRLLSTAINAADNLVTFWQQRHDQALQLDPAEQGRENFYIRQLHRNDQRVEIVEIDEAEDMIEMSSPTDGLLDGML